jgi:AbrB family looped-hinge helix DNA binding protein
MPTTKLGARGQVVLPERIRKTRRWKTGTEFEIVPLGQGILLRPVSPFPATTVDDVVGCVPYQGPPL